MSTWDITIGDDEAAIFTLTKDKHSVDLTGATITAILVDAATGVELVSAVQDEANPNGDWSIGKIPIVFTNANTSTIPTTTTKGKLQIKVLNEGNLITSWWFDKVTFRVGF